MKKFKCLICADRCLICGHMRKWHHALYIPVTAGKMGRGPECRRCAGEERHHEFRKSG